MRRIVIKKRKDIFFKYYDEVYEYTSRKFRAPLLEKVMRRLRLPYCPYMYGEWKKILDNVDEVVLFENGFLSTVPRYIKKYNPEIRVYLFYWNVINEDNRHILENPYVDKFYSFDIDDCEKYGLYYNPGLYSHKIEKKGLQVNNDFMFIGRAKNRKHQILEIQDKLEKLNYKCDISIIETEKGLLSYEDCLDKTEQAKCSLEIVNNGQCGVTLRSWECLFWNKKLITNNSRIKDYDFYRDNNIFVIQDISDLNNNSAIISFLEAPMTPVQDEIVNYYTFEEWLKRFSDA